MMELRPLVFQLDGRDVRFKKLSAFFTYDFFLQEKHKSNDVRQIWKCIEISLNWLFIKIAYNSAHILYGLANLHMFSCFLQSADFIFLFSEFRLGCEVTRLFSWNF